MEVEDGDGEVSSPDDDNVSEGTSKRKKSTLVLLLVFTCLYTAFYGGAFFGWGPMQLMLEADGAFSEKCEDTTDKDKQDGTCDAQTSSLLNVQMVAQLTLIFSPLWGHVADKRGTAMVMNLLALSGVGGITLLVTASALSLGALLYPAFILIGCTAVANSILTVETGMLFQEPTRRRVISALNALYDAAALTYLILWYVQRATDAPFAILMTGYLVLGIVCMGASALLWCRVISQLVDATDIPPIDNSEVPGGAGDRRHNDIASETVDGNHRVAETQTEKGAATDQTVSSTSSSYILIAERSPKQQLLSKQFVLLSLFFAMMTARNIWTLTTVRDFLGHLGDDEQDNKYLSIFTFLTPVSILGLPFADQALAKYGYHAGLQCINALALLHGIVQVSGENLNVQIFGFVVFSFFRCFLFSVSFSFLPTFLSEQVLGKAAGLLIFVAGIALFLNIPLANLAVRQLDGDFFWPNLFYTLIVIPNIFIVWLIGGSIQTEQEKMDLRE